MSTKMPFRVNSLQFIGRTLYPFRIYLVALLLVLFVSSVNLFWKAQVIKNLVDSILSSTKNTIWIHTGYLMVTLCIELVVFRVQEWCSLQYEPALQNYSTTCVFQHVLKREYRFFQHHFSGNLVAHVHDLATGIPALVRIFLYDYVVNVLLVIVSLITLGSVQVGCAILVVVWFLLILFTSALATPHALTLGKHTAQTGVQILGYISDTFNHIAITRLFSAQSCTVKQLNKLQAQYGQSSQRYRWFMLKFHGFQGISFQCYQGICILFLIYMHSQNQITVGDFVMILSMNGIITEALWKMFKRMQEFNTLWGKISQAVQVLLEPPYIQDQPGASALVVKSGSICFEAVTFSHSKTTPLFDNETIYIRAKQKVGLVGYSGSGKTTFFNLIARLFDIEQGIIRIDGQDIRKVTQDSLHQAITIVPQESNLLHSTILENIRYGNPGASDHQVIEAAQKACADEFISKLPHQYQTLVGERGMNLSGGQRQRIAIARAFLKNSPIVLLDESTAHLDQQTAHQVYASLASFLQDKTALIISHHLAILQDVDRILVFQQGKIVEDGTPLQLAAQGGLYAALLNRPDSR